MSRVVNMLFQVERRQQADKTTRVRVVDILYVQIEVAADDDWARVNDQRLEHCGQLLKEHR